MEGTFTLPPAAMNRSPPSSPVLQRKRTLSGSVKGKDELPPPPSRQRKYVHMKPKDDPPTPAAPSTAKPNSPKRKQPSATSAAGRKIARKTAHSIIERRRRSKMNEEFGVLKDMIPACKGVEMHKLAILQAGIEYVRYLQGCVDKLQDERTRDRRRDDDEEELEDAVVSGKTPSASPFPEASEYRRASTTTTSTSTATHSAQPSPALRPNMSSSSLASQRQLPPPTNKPYSTSPPPLVVQTPTQTGVSPAFNAIHFSPDLSRTFSHHTQQQIQQGHGQYGKYSPSILPLPQAAMPMALNNQGHPQGQQEGHAEATATAALMMLTNDRRSVNGNGANGTGRGGGMSVKDLLSH